MAPLWILALMHQPFSCFQNTTTQSELRVSHVTLLKDNLVTSWLSLAQMDDLNISQQKAQKQQMTAKEGRVPSDANGQKSVKMSEPLVNSLAKCTLIMNVDTN